MLGLAGHRHEPYRGDRLARESLLGPRDPHQLLLSSTQRCDQAAADLELVQKGPRNIFRGRCG